MAAELPELRDIHLPAEPSWWPPAIGWWLLLVLVVGAIALWLYRRPARRHAQRERRIVAELASLEAAWRSDRDDVRFAAALSNHLRRLSLLVAPDGASLTGARWIAFLDRHGDGFPAVADALTDAPYRPAASVDAAQLYATVERHTRRVLATELAAASRRTAGAPHV